jgi:hypothetical protein
MGGVYAQAVRNGVTSGEPDFWLGWRGWAEVLLWFALAAVTGLVMRFVLFPTLGRSATFALMALIVLMRYAAGSLWQRRRTLSAKRNH